MAETTTTEKTAAKAGKAKFVALAKLPPCGHAGCAALANAAKAYHLNVYIGSNPSGALTTYVKKRGLRPAVDGELALLSMWWARESSSPSLESQGQAVVESASSKIADFFGQVGTSIFDGFGYMFALTPAPPAGTKYACYRRGCNRPTWNGEPNQYCSKDCWSRDQQAMKAAGAIENGRTASGAAEATPKAKAKATPKVTSTPAPAAKPKAKATAKFIKRTPERGHRGVIELCGLGLVPMLDDKRFLATLLHTWGVNAWSPLTSLRPEDLRNGGPCDVPGSETDLWFLKHANMNLNKGVSCHLGRTRCQKAWMALTPKARQNYVAQREVKDVLLDEEGRKIVLRIYVLLLVATSPEGGGYTTDGTAAWALLRREFLVKSCGGSYDPDDPDPNRHIYSSLNSPTGGKVGWCAGSEWHMSEKVWPQIRIMLSQCMGPLLPMAASGVPPGDNGARGLAFELMGIDVLLDKSLRPWLIEINTFPDVKPMPDDPEITRFRAEVVEDIARAVVDPALDSGCLRGPRQTEAWESIAEWNEGQPVPGALASEPPRDFLQDWKVRLLPWLQPGWSDGSEGTAGIGALLSATL